jgi:hypothetical protein
MQAAYAPRLLLKSWEGLDWLVWAWRCWIGEFWVVYCMVLDVYCSLRVGSIYVIF